MKFTLPLLTLGLFLSIISGQGPRADAPKRSFQDEQAASRMELMAIWKLTDELKLTEKQAEIFFPRMRTHREEIKGLNKVQKDLLRPLVEKAERGEEITDEELEAALQEVTKMEHQKAEKRNAFINDMKGTLTNAQLVKLMVFQDRFIRDIQQKFRERRPQSDRPGPRRSWK